MTSEIEPAATVQDVAVTTSSKPPRVRAPGVRLWTDRNFNLFWAGQTFDALGDAAALLIIPLLVLAATGSVAQMGLVTVVIGVADLIASVVSGLLVDRIDRRKFIIFCDVGRALLYPVIPLCWWLLGPQVWPIYAVAFITAFLTTSFLVAYTSVVPNLVDKDQIADANGRLQATVALAYVVSPAIAGFASKHLGANDAVMVIAASYAASVSLMLLVRLRKVAELSDVQGGREGVFAGIKFLMGHEILKPVTLLLASMLFISGAAINLFIYRLKQELGQQDDTVGLIFGLAGMGAVIAGAIAPIMYRRLGFGFSFLGSFILMGAATAVSGVAAGVTLIAVMAVAYSFGATIRAVTSMTIRQQVTPDHLLGRVSAAFWAMLTVLGPLGTGAASVLAAWAGASAVLVAIGVLSILVAIAGLFTRANGHYSSSESS